MPASSQAASRHTPFRPSIWSLTFRLAATPPPEARADACCSLGGLASRVRHHSIVGRVTMAAVPTRLS